MLWYFYGIFMVFLWYFYGLWFMVYGLWSMVCGLWFMVYGLWSIQFVFGLVLSGLQTILKSINFVVFEDSLMICWPPNCSIFYFISALSNVRLHFVIKQIHNTFYKLYKFYKPVLHSFPT
jgi:hypothetical protein